MVHYYYINILIFYMYQKYLLSSIWFHLLTVLSKKYLDTIQKLPSFSAALADLLAELYCKYHKSKKNVIQWNPCKKDNLTWEKQSMEYLACMLQTQRRNKMKTCFLKLPSFICQICIKQSWLLFMVIFKVLLYLHLAHVHNRKWHMGQNTWKEMARCTLNKCETDTSLQIHITESEIDAHQVRCVQYYCMVHKIEVIELWVFSRQVNLLDDKSQIRKC